jgi:hypothetical protein
MGLATLLTGPEEGAYTAVGETDQSVWGEKWQQR